MTWSVHRLPYIGITKQLSLRFRFPPVAEQKRIAATLGSSLEATPVRGDLYTQKVAALDELKKSLLQRAFAGEL